MKPSEQAERLHAMRWRQIQQDIRTLMGEEWGRRLAHWIINDLGPHGAERGLVNLGGPSDSTFDPGVRDGACLAMHQSFYDGAHTAMRKLHNVIQDEAPAQALTMVIEQAKASFADIALGSTIPSAGEST